MVSESWVRESTARHFDIGNAQPHAPGYDYLWWMGRDERTGLEYVLAVGYGGQFIFIVPALNTLIAAATAWSSVRNADQNFMLVLSTIVETVLPGLG